MYCTLDLGCRVTVLLQAVPAILAIAVREKWTGTVAGGFLLVTVVLIYIGYRRIRYNRERKTINGYLIAGKTISRLPAEGLGDGAIGRSEVIANNGYQLASHALFLKKLQETVVAHLSYPGLDVDQLCDIMNMSRRNLYRKIKQASGLTPLELINDLRLKRAAELLEGGDKRMYEIADEIGFKSRIVFTRNFTREFGMSPTEYSKKYHALRNLKFNTPQ
ncbi:helix-turn-helix domain-containing protein [Mucilaginibacter aquariorum]|uniref:AraC family transcriptional regulator n=1 Tax=Mucilaginibacter aquariorum TaxID=2967225 RepID=A0ABT1T5P9_9SPHI|nr:AraC family transcriptional regulator [Mucilaginibacter aquariorum]MCQ6959812.1 AraC family transcriptional regulator [Mucilaginibacter aquariorum]